MKKFLDMLEKKPVVFTVILSVILNLFIEILARRSFFDTLSFVIRNPFITAYNTVIILFSLSVSLYFSKRYSMYLLVSFLWVALGVTNLILISLRGTPLSAVDFVIFKTGFTLMHLYLSLPVIILLAILTISAISGIICMFVKSRRIKPSYIKALTLTLVCAASIFLTSHSILTTEEVSASSNSISKTYENYGFACCFSYSLLGRGVAQPEAYSSESMAKLFDTLNAEKSNLPQNTPNIIYVQLESFFDPAYLDISGLEISEEPIPNFSRLKASCKSGFFEVPSFGGGTANTEFEVLSQLSLESFGLAEYPYTTSLKEKTCESTAFCLRENGYSTHAIHNHTATFYDRDIVYSNLGFDTFTPIEYMPKPERTPKGWAKDYIIEEEIIKAMKSTPEQDFVFAVSVQGHGQYPSEFDGELPIKASGLENTELQTNLEYYLYQLKEMDDFIGKLTSTLSSYPEDTVVVFYGDHLPSLKIGELSKTELGRYPTSCDPYTTEYVVWSNFGLSDKDEDIPAHMLTSRLFSMLGMNTGVVTKLNQAKNLAPDIYRSYSKMLAYDMFYGDRYIAKLENLAPTAIRLGISDITISSVASENDGIYISGIGFNEYSIVWVNGKKTETEFISDRLLRISSDDIKRGEGIKVVQEAEIKALGETRTIIF